MTYDPIDTNETDNNADGKLTIDDLTATTVAGLDTSSGTGNEQIFTDGNGGLTARGYVSELPIAYSNLVAWYPFDSARYTGSNADDVTAIIGGSGDDAAYDGTVNGATYQSSGGVTDINAGANSGAFDFDGSNDSIDITTMDNSNFSSELTFAVWANYDDIGLTEPPFNISDGANDAAVLGRGLDTSEILFGFDNGNTFNEFAFTNITTGNWIHLALSWDGSTVTAYIDGSSVGSFSAANWEASNNNSFDYYIGKRISGTKFFDGTVDDVRLYNAGLTGTQINQIYQNTEP